MSTPSPIIQQRFSEVAACSCASRIMAQLLALNTAPNSRQWGRQREDRRALWQEVLDTAQTQVDTLKVAQEAPRKRAARVKAAAVEPTAMAAS